VTTHTDEDVPAELIGRDMARAYFGCVRENPGAYGSAAEDTGSEIALEIRGADRPA